VSASETSSGKTLVLGLFILLFIAHQDFWLWADDTLVMGFMPIGLAYHALFSVICSCLWALACFRTWPEELERWANEEAPTTSSQAEEEDS
tara:strand:- start:554 stop:826 length:273 start_codon:yes stop_codon:yes gene_type:complete